MTRTEFLKAMMKSGTTMEAATGMADAANRSPRSFDAKTAEGAYQNILHPERKTTYPCAGCSEKIVTRPDALCGACLFDDE